MVVSKQSVLIRHFLSTRRIVLVHAKLGCGPWSLIVGHWLSLDILLVDDAKIVIRLLRDASVSFLLGLLHCFLELLHVGLFVDLLLHVGAGFYHRVFGSVYELIDLLESVV